MLRKVLEISAMEERQEIGKDEVVAKLKDDGDFDKLRLKIIRKLKENEQLRDEIVAIAKQSIVLNRSGAENLKPRQISDAIYEEVGDKLMNKVSESIWGIIRSDDGMKSEIQETVQSVYNKLVNPRANDESGSSANDSVVVRKEPDKNGSYRIPSACKVTDNLSANDPREPPGFFLAGNHENNHLDQQQKDTIMPDIHQAEELGEQLEKTHQSKDIFEVDDDEVGVPPGFSAKMESKLLPDGSDEDPDVPPGFG